MSAGTAKQDGCTIDFHAPNISVSGTIKTGPLAEINIRF